MRPQGAVAERNSFGTAGLLSVGRETYAVHRLAGLAPAGLPIGLRIVLENLLRHEDGVRVTAEQVESLLAREPGAASPAAVDLSPSRVFCTTPTACRCSPTSPPCGTRRRPSAPGRRPWTAIGP